MGVINEKRIKGDLKKKKEDMQQGEMEKEKE